MQRLSESSFLHIDLSSIVNKNQKADKPLNNNDLTTGDTVGKTQANGVNTNQEQVKKKLNIQEVANWEKELEKRLKENSEMSPESRKKPYEIEIEFFKDFFNAVWDAECAQQLISIGSNLRQAIKVLGFDLRTNPILRFLTLSYVKEHLIKTKLLNVNTFKAIYNAVANKWVVDSEFYFANNYNILYCKDLYKKPNSEMQEYLQLQKLNLSTSVSKYTAEDQDKNRRIFLHFPKNTEKNLEAKAKKQLEMPYTKLPSMKAASSTLNDLSLVKTILGTRGSTNKLDKEETSDKVKKVTGSKAINAIAGKKLNIEQTAAVLQYLGASTGSVKALKALSHKAFKGLSMDSLVKATNQISSLVSKINLTENEADELVSILINNLY